MNERKQIRDHGGGVDAAARRYGGARADWLDLSTGISPDSYPFDDIPKAMWQALPDTGAAANLLAAARSFWRVPDDHAILAAPGASSLIAQIPRLAPAGHVAIPGPTYNEHAAAFSAQGWQINAVTDPDARVLVHPNNPDGRLWRPDDLDAALTVVDESFADCLPDQSLVGARPPQGTIVLKSFGKFWGLAGVRLGFAIGDPALLDALAEMLGPWPVSGPALAIGTAALNDHAWAETHRKRLTAGVERLDDLMTRRGATVIGGTLLFRLYEVDDAKAWQDRLAQARIWSRAFPYNARWLRLGLPPQNGWGRLEAAL